MSASTWATKVFDPSPFDDKILYDPPAGAKMLKQHVPYARPGGGSTYFRLDIILSS